MKVIEMGLNEVWVITQMSSIWVGQWQIHISTSAQYSDQIVFTPNWHEKWHLFQICGPYSQAGTSRERESLNNKAIIPCEGKKQWKRKNKTDVEKKNDHQQQRQNFERERKKWPDKQTNRERLEGRKLEVENCDFFVFTFFWATKTSTWYVLFIVWNLL